MTSKIAASWVPKLFLFDLANAVPYHEGLGIDPLAGLGERWCAQRVCHRLHADAQTIPGNPFQLGTRLTKTYNFVPEKRKVLRCALAEVPTYDSPAQEPQGHEASVVGPREGIPPGIAFTDRKIETSKSFLLMSSITRQTSLLQTNYLVLAGGSEPETRRTRIPSSRDIQRFKRQALTSRNENTADMIGRRQDCESKLVKPDQYESIHESPLLRLQKDVGRIW
ncbi:unnamed protein product [Cladocopium goreaui]|uniref:Uncharacterized protein n=1 Tax=Cladocopium goreaui TaxID=2562237 RepID=A0A9P1G1T2_9DINO|nr:unnamed protein product [Cladocopium goreaui]